MATLRKGTVQLGGVAVAGVGAIQWRFQTGTQPYVGKFSVHNEVWKKLKLRQGQPLDLKVVDSRGIITVVKSLYIIESVAGDGPNRTSFAVADIRWKWNRIFVSRDFNMKKKSGDKNIDNKTLPIESKVTTDAYDYKPYSLKGGEDEWTAKEAVTEILGILEEGNFKIESFPVEEGSEGQLTLQDVVIRDQGDTALARVLRMIPGAEVYIDTNGKAVVFDGVDLDAAETHLKRLPRLTWEGEKPEMVDRKAVRPSEIRVHYQREVEILLTYEDDFSTTSQLTVDVETPYLVNVLPTVDPVTTVTVLDPERGEVEKEVGPGTWVEVKPWLEAMEKDKAVGSYPWTIDTIKRYWLTGDLESKLIGTNLRGKKDGSDTTNQLNRVRALIENFRQTFRVSRRYMDRIINMSVERVGLLDPVTGQLGPSAVWNEACLVPTQKGKLSSRKDPEKGARFFNVNSIPDEGNNVVKTDPGPNGVQIKNVDVGIIKIVGLASPYGTFSSVLPGFVVGTDGDPEVPVRNLKKQNVFAMGVGMRLQDGTNEVWLNDSYKLKVMLTIVPGSPNNKGRYHQEIVQADEIQEMFRTAYRIESGTGPPLDIFVSPAEATARYAWKKDKEATTLIATLLGLDDDDPTTAGLKEGQRLTDGDAFVLVNEQRELYNHARAMAAQAWAPYADSLHGRVTTRMALGLPTLKGNMSGASIHIAAAPSGRMNLSHEFSGYQRPIDRFALMSEDARKVILGIVSFRSEG